MTNTDEFHVAILEKLSESVGGGSYKEVVTLPSGEQKTFYVSQATGFAFQKWLCEYKAHFQLPAPEWVSYEHPYHRRLLFELAIGFALKLPDLKPDDLEAGKIARTICERSVGGNLSLPGPEPDEVSGTKRLISFIPRLLESADFRKDLKTNLGDRAPKIFSDIENGKEIEGEDGDLLFDAAYDAFRSNAHNVLSLGWDGGFPGMSGGVWVSELEGAFFVTSSDYEEEGPFDSLDEALTCECFGVVTPSPELDSQTLPLEKLLEIAHSVVDWECEGDIWINSKRFVARGDELVEEAPE